MGKPSNRETLGESESTYIAEIRLTELELRGATKFGLAIEIIEYKTDTISMDVSSLEFAVLKDDI